MAGARSPSSWSGLQALLDTTIVNVALPSIRDGLHASSASLEWIVSGYGLAYGLALVPGGRPGARGVATAFAHSAQLALAANLGFMLVALIIVLALPRNIPGH